VASETFVLVQQSAQNMTFPYDRWTSDPLWPTVNDAISDLVVNADLTEQTAREYIVGYIGMKIRSAPDQVTSE
jgi:hypothetical protein